MIRPACTTHQFSSQQVSPEAHPCPPPKGPVSSYEGHLQTPATGPDGQASRTARGSQEPSREAQRQHGRQCLDLGHGPSELGDGTFLSLQPPRPPGNQCTGWTRRELGARAAAMPRGRPRTGGPERPAAGRSAVTTGTHWWCFRTSG